MNDIVKFTWLFVFTNFVRFLKVFPNNDPIMGSLLATTKTSGVLFSSLFAVSTIFFFDYFTSGIGIWTYGVVFAYLLIILFSKVVFRLFKRVNLIGYAGLSVFGVLIFDFITGPVMSSLIFKINFAQAFFGQIPFTLLHLGSAVFYTILLVPILDKNVNQAFNVLTYFNKFFSVIFYKWKMIFFVIFFIAIVGGCSQSDDISNSVKDSGETYTATFEIILDGEIFLENISFDFGVNAFDLMNKSFLIEYDMYAGKPFITSIQGMKSNESHYWSLKVNDEYAQKGIGDYILTNDTVISWEYVSMGGAFE